MSKHFLLICPTEVDPFDNCMIKYMHIKNKGGEIMEETKMVECLVSIQSTLISVLQEQKAQRIEILELKKSQEEGFKTLRQEMKSMETGLRQEMKNMEKELRHEIKNVEIRLNHKISNTELRIREDAKKDIKGLKNYIDIVAKGLQEHENNHIA